jgi:hypothetical protein
VVEIEVTVGEVRVGIETAAELVTEISSNLKRGRAPVVPETE